MEINPEKPCGGRRETDFKDEGRSGAFTHCQSERSPSLFG